MANQGRDECREDLAENVQGEINIKWEEKHGEGSAFSEGSTNVTSDGIRSNEVGQEIQEYASFDLKSSSILRSEENKSDSCGLNKNIAICDEENLDARSKRGNYHKFSPQEKWNIGELAAEIGNTKAMRQFQSQYPGLKLAESTVRSFKMLYLKAMMKRKPQPKPVRKVRGKYQTYSVEDRAIIGKYAYENGNANSLRKFKKNYPGLSESTVRGFKNMYMREIRKRAAKELARNRDVEETTDKHHKIIETNGNVTSNLTEEILAHGCKNCKDDIMTAETVNTIEINALPRKKRGRPGKIPPHVEETIISYLNAIAEKDSKMLTTKAVIAITKGVFMTEARSLLSEFGGELKINKHWAHSFLQRHNMALQSIASTTDTANEKNSEKTEYDIESQKNLIIKEIDDDQIRLVNYADNGTDNGSTIVVVVPKIRQ